MARSDRNGLVTGSSHVRNQIEALVSSGMEVDINQYYKSFEMIYSWQSVPWLFPLVYICYLSIQINHTNTTSLLV